MLAELGHNAYGSDNAENVLQHTKILLAKKGLTATLKLSDMTECWDKNTFFHGALSWDAIHHNTLGNIQKTIDIIYDRLLPGGMFIGTIKCKSGLNLPDGEGYPGDEIEPDTIVPLVGAETGVPHHYFDEDAIRKLFKKWKIEILVEQRFTYVETVDKYWENNPFNYSSWGILAKKHK